MNETIPIIVYSHNIHNDFKAFKGYPLHQSGTRKYGILHECELQVPKDSSRIGLHLSFPGAAIYVGGNISIVREVNGIAAPESLTCYHCDIEDIECIVAIMNLTSATKFNRVIPCAPMYFDGWVEHYNEYSQEKITEPFDKWLISKYFDIDAMTWYKVPSPHNTEKIGSHLHVNGITPVHDPRFGVAHATGPPYLLTRDEIRNAKIVEIENKIKAVEAQKRDIDRQLADLRQALDDIDL